ncbi:hypothetical protein RCL1_008342 [Eukaryota sp. TZLM3-RCL]
MFKSLNKDFRAAYNESSESQLLKDSYSDASLDHAYCFMPSSSSLFSSLYVLSILLFSFILLFLSTSLIHLFVPSVPSFFSFFSYILVNVSSTSHVFLIHSIILLLSFLGSIILISATPEPFGQVLSEYFFKRIPVILYFSFIISTELIFLLLYFSSYPHKYLILISLISSFISLLLIIPFILYLFNLRHPAVLMSLIVENGIKSVKSTINSRNMKKIDNSKLFLVNSLTHLSSASFCSKNQKHADVASRAVDSLCFFSRFYGLYKSRLSPQWFEISQGLPTVFDMASLSLECIADMSERQLWVEWAVLRNFQSIIQRNSNALGTSNSSLVSHVARSTRRLAIAGLYRKDLNVFDLVIRFFNSYLRHVINIGDVRTLANVLHEFKNLALKALFLASRLQHQMALRPGLNENLAQNITPSTIEERVTKIVHYLRYYSIVCLEADLGAGCEIIAHDVGTVVAESYKLRRNCHDDILALFLTVDDTAESKGKVSSLRGIRRAQIKLALSYLCHGQIRFARLIQQDMIDEPHERLQSIWEELLAIESKEFYEINDRGSNDDYLSPQQKEKLPLFFSYFKGFQPPSVTCSQDDSHLEREIKGLRLQSLGIVRRHSEHMINLPNGVE